MSFVPTIVGRSTRTKSDVENRGEDAGGLKRIECAGADDNDVGNDSFFGQMSFAMKAQEMRDLNDIMADDSTKCL